MMTRKEKEEHCPPFQSEGWRERRETIAKRVMVKLNK